MFLRCERYCILLKHVLGWNRCCLGRLSLFNLFLRHFLLFLRTHSHNILRNILPCVLCCLLHEAFCAQALNIHVGHGSIASGSASFSELVARLVAVLVLHHLHTVLLQAVPQHLRVRLQTVVDCAVGHQTSPCCVDQGSHCTASLLDPARFAGIDHLGRQVGGHPLGQIAHPVRHVPGHLHRSVRCRHGCFDGVPGESANLSILLRLAQPLLSCIGDILDQLTGLLSSHLDADC